MGIPPDILEDLSRPGERPLRIDHPIELLDVPYFHVVFTVPDLIATIAFQNQTVVYDILFRAASETLRTIAADREHLGAEIGFLSVLLTLARGRR